MEGLAHGRRRRPHHRPRPGRSAAPARLPRRRLQPHRPAHRDALHPPPDRHLPHSTLDRLLDTRARPRLPSPELLDAFLTGCSVPAPRRSAWTAALRLLADNPGKSARALAEIARTRSSAPYRPQGRRAWFHDRVEEDALHEEKNQQLQALRKNRTVPDELDRADDHGTGEDEYLR